MAVLGFWFLTQALEASRQVNLGLQGGVAFWAHIGGFLAGMALMPLLAERPPPGPPDDLIYPRDMPGLHGFPSDG